MKGFLIKCLLIMSFLRVLEQPGLLGPRLPQLLAAAALSRAEIESHFRHFEGVALRRDARDKACYHHTHFQDPAVAALMY